MMDFIQRVIKLLLYFFNLFSPIPKTLELHNILLEFIKVKEIYSTTIKEKHVQYTLKLTKVNRLQGLLSVDIDILKVISKIL